MRIITFFVQRVPSAALKRKNFACAPNGERPDRQEGIDVNAKITSALQVSSTETRTDVCLPFLSRSCLFVFDFVSLSLCLFLAYCAVHVPLSLPFSLPFPLSVSLSLWCFSILLGNLHLGFLPRCFPVCFVVALVYTRRSSSTMAKPGNRFAKSLLSTSSTRAFQRRPVSSRLSEARPR
jgi:hypothetical protein